MFAPGEETECEFGDRFDTAFSKIFDYMLRDGWSSEHWSWRFKDWNR